MKQLLVHRLIVVGLSLCACAVDLAAAAGPLADWTLEQVIDRIEQANGGMNAIEEVRDVRVLGQMDVGDSTVDFLLLKRRPNMVRINVFYARMSEETAFDGKQAWRRTNLPDGEELELIAADALDELNLDTDFDGPLIGGMDPSLTAELIGVERIDRVDYFKVEVSGERQRNIHFIDSRTFRKLKKEVYSVETGELQSVSYFNDYRNHSPIWVAHTVRQEFADGGERIIRLQSAEFNVGILERVFSVPQISRR
jgi:hypothetical protein